ncbi:MAG: TrkH family potassium uptake protein [Steroidobacterales bacterium]
MNPISALRGTVLPISNVLAGVVAVFGVAMLVPAAMAIIGDDSGQRAFVDSAFAIVLLGGLWWLATRRYRRELRIRDGILLVSLSWILVPALAALPLMIGIPGLSFTDAYFESVSGLTTTGATVLNGLDQLAASLNFWRHLLHWIGGMGIIVLAVAILPLLGVGGMQLFRAETPGPMKDSKLTPRIAHTAKALWYVYAGITLACVLALHIAGMSWFDAICHAFSAMSLGGFSTHNQSIGYFHSLPIELVLSTFQIIAAMSFATHFLAVRERSLAPYMRDTEVKAILAILAVSVVGLALFLTWQKIYPDFVSSLRHASFNIITIATTCGFSTQDFALWPLFAPLWMLFLSCIIPSAGSTGGGIKMIRAVLLAKQTARQLTGILHPNLMRPVKVGQNVVDNSVILAVLGFVFLYFMSVVVLTLILIASGLDLTAALTATVASINNTGPGLGIVGPASNYSVLNDFQTWVCTLAMLLGRLEVFTFIVIFTPAFWKK